MNKILFSILYLIVDILWISTMSSLFYKHRIEKIQKETLKFKILPALLSYFTLLMTMFYICIPLSIHYKNIYHPSITFGMVGFVIYGVYNFTNSAIFNDYEWDFIIMDTLWGIFSFMFFGFLYNNFALFNRVF